MPLTTDQVTLLVGAIIALLQAVTIAIGIWNKNHLEAVRAEQTRANALLSGKGTDNSA